MSFTTSGLVALTSALAAPTLLTAHAGAFATDSLEKPRASQAVHTTAADALEIVEFWRQAGQGLWFAKDAAFDQRFRERFIGLYERAARGELQSWPRTPDGALGLLILLDQFPRNAFRGTPRMYATDELARKTADAAIAAGFDRRVPADLSLFMYLPFGHSENLADQERSVALAQRLGQPSIAHAEMHRDIIRRFGRFPHRNPILGRAMRPEEQTYLDEGGFKG